MYDETEAGTTRFVGFLSDDARFDLAITNTDHFFGKHIVICLQTNRSAIINQKDATNVDYVKEAFNLQSDVEAEQMSEFLSENLL